MKKVHLGLDLGITSIGWSLVDENQNIIVTGSHLFPKLSDPQNNSKYGEGIRGELRRTRRMLNRRKQRKIDFLNMIDLWNDNHQLKIEELAKKNKKPISSLYKEKYQSIFGFEKNNSSTDFLFNEAKKFDIYKIWKKGLSKEINAKELFVFLYFKLGLRGVFFKSFKWDNNKKYNYEDSLLKIIYNDVYFKKCKKYRNKSNSDLTYSIYHNWKDIETILKNCSYIDQEFIDDYKKIFFRHREFSKGPGNFKLGDKQSKWGIRWDGDNCKKTEQEMEQINLWDTKIGVCTISLYENNGDINNAIKRLNQYFCIAELSNIISQLANVKIADESISDFQRLSKLQIINIINNSLIEDKRITRTRIENFLGNKKIISFPTTKDGKHSNFDQITKIRKYYSKNNGFFSFSNRSEEINIQEQYELLNQIDVNRFKLISKYFEKDESKDNKFKTQNREYDKSIEKLKENCSSLLNINFKINYESLANFSDIKESDINGTREYGIISYEKFIQNFFSTNNKAQSFHSFFKKEIKEGQKLIFNFNNNSKYINENMFKQQDFISPNTRNTLKEMIRIINKILRQYIYKNDYKLESIMLETTWSEEQINESLLSEQKRKDIISFQKVNEDRRKEAKKELEKNGIIVSEKNIKKYILWKEQNGKDVYTKESILLSQITNCQIDHIIPESISFNSKWENLVLTLKNSQKGNKLAREFIQNDEQIINLWNSLYKVDEKEKNTLARLKIKKLKNLMMIRTELNNKNFINSNLCETTYAIRKAKDGLTFFIENFNNNYVNKNSSEYEKISDCDIRTVSGFITNKLRNDFFRLPKKDRKISSHHSHDASMIAMFSSFNHINIFYNKIKKIGSKKYILEKLYGKQNDNISIKNLCNIIKNSEELKDKILNSKCIYSFKKVSIFPKKFNKKNIEEQWEFIKSSLKPKQIFSNQSIDSYVEIDNNKYKVEYLQLNDFTLNKNYDSIYNKILNLFKCLKDVLSGIDKNNIKDIRDKINNLREKENVFAKKIITDWKTLYKLYLCVESYINDIDFSNKKPQWIFEKYINELKEKNILNGLSENGIVVNNEYIETILKKYIPLIDLNNFSFTKVFKIKFINSKIHSIAFDLNKKKINNKNIFAYEKYDRLSKNTSIWGHEEKVLVLVKYKIRNKFKYEILKVNWLNQIINEPNVPYEKILFIDSKKWYLINNEIYKIGSLDIDSSRLWVEPVSNTSIAFESEYKKRKTFESWMKYGDNEWQKKIFTQLICQGKKII